MIDMKMKFITCASQESSPQIKKIFIPRSMQVRNQSPKAYLQGEDLHPLSRSLQKLLDIGNAIHPKHWIQIWPCHYIPNTISTKPSLISVGLGLLRSCTHLKKKKRDFPKYEQSIKVKIKTSNHENLCFEMRASFKSGKSMPKPLLWEKSCLSEVVVPYKG